MEKILTLCFPTYNRGWCMKEQLERLKKCPTSILNKIEIIISDNCSTDNTEQVVKDAIDSGFPCIYHKNERNLGMDGNFVTCFRMAKGKYVWLLGDDDPILVDSLVAIVNKLSSCDDYGLIHIWCKKERISSDEFISYNDNNKFARAISYYTTFISANIVRTKYVPKIDFEKYMGTWFTLLPLYITAFCKESQNLIVNFRVFEDSKDWRRNGGYNYFEVFAKNYLEIWKEYLDKDAIDNKTYGYLKKDIFKDLLAGAIFDFFIKRQKRHNYSIDNAWTILFHYYGRYPYFYYYSGRYIIARGLNKIIRDVVSQNKNRDFSRKG